MIQLALTSQFIVIFLSLFVNCSKDYENKLTKLWSMSSASDSPRTAVINVTSGSINVQPTSYGGGQATRRAKMPTKYAFRPRAIPLSKVNEQSQIERSIHYTDEAKTKQKTEILFPGNYFKISEVKKENNVTEDSSFNPLDGVPFHPKLIPLMRDGFKRRSMVVNDDDEPTIEKPNGYTEPTAMRRSISSYIFGDDDEKGDEDDLVELDVNADAEDDKHDELRHKTKRKKFKIKKKYARYLLPLLLAYKLKFFAMIPLMMGGLVLLVGATGLAGFFFALFAAVMGLQKGSY